MISIFKDKNLKEKVENKIIFENELYYIDFGNLKSDIITKEIEKSKLDKFINWHHRNRIGTIRIINFIGIIRLFGNIFDVRTRKFLEEMEGREQFEFLLDDLTKLSKDLIFSYASPSMAVRDVDRYNISPSILMRFNYYRQIILDWPVGFNLESLFEKILMNPHVAQLSYRDLDYTWNTKKIDHKFLISLINSNKYYSRIPENHHLAKSRITTFLSKNTSGQYFAIKSEIQKKRFSFDTLENRFIKFFFREIENVCLELKKIKNLPENILEDNRKILSVVRNALRNEIFLEVGNIFSMPSSSSVLLNRPGYREIYAHYIYSKLGVIHLFEDIEKQSLYIDLKDINTLYEYWVFYKIAIALLGEKIIIEQKKAAVKNGAIKHSVIFRNDKYSVSYNVGFSKANRKCYSLNLRPDINVQIEKDDKDIYMLFDAKYKVRDIEVEKEEEEETYIERTFKTEDLHKMHCYLDAITGALFSVAVYPGTEFRFYENDIDKPVRTTPSDIIKFEGVGAIPLMPGDQESNKILSDFVRCVKSFAEKY